MRFPRSLGDVLAASRQSGTTYQLSEDTMNHSPLPWKIGVSGNIYPDIEVKYNICTGITNPQDAAYIVHAANTLPQLRERNAELVEALRRLIQQMEFRDIETHALKYARTVLAKEAANDM